MREVPKVLHTTLAWKLARGSALITLPDGKKCKNITMDNPPTVPKAAIARPRNMSQRLPGKRVIHLASVNDRGRYSLFRLVKSSVKVLRK
jgi:hypothetical protein